MKIDFGAYQGTILFSETNAEKVNKGKPLPICLLSAIEDALRVDKAKVKTSKKGNSLTTQGGIAAGDFELNLNIDESVTPVAEPCRKVPFKMKTSIKDKIDELEPLDIITKVNAMGFEHSPCYQETHVNPFMY